MLLTALGAYVLDTVREGVQLTNSTAERKANLRRRQMIEERVSVQIMMCCIQYCDCIRMAQLNSPHYTPTYAASHHYVYFFKLLEVTKEAWPECVQNHLTALECKDFIDNEIYELFTERDQYVRSIIIGKRTKGDKWYNAVVIMMNDADMVMGRDGDGLVYYDL